MHVKSIFDKYMYINAKIKRNTSNKYLCFNIIDENQYSLLSVYNHVDFAIFQQKNK